MEICPKLTARSAAGGAAPPAGRHQPATDAGYRLAAALRSRRHLGPAAQAPGPDGDAGPQSRRRAGGSGGVISCKPAPALIFLAWPFFVRTECKPANPVRTQVRTFPIPHQPAHARTDAAFGPLA